MKSSGTKSKTECLDIIISNLQELQEGLPKDYKRNFLPKISCIVHGRAYR